MKAIINVFSNIQANKNNHSGLEATFWSKKYDLDYIGKKNKLNKDVENYVDIGDIIDLDIYQKIFIQLSQPNFFGGVISDDTIEKVEKLSRYEGEVFIICSDPRIKPINCAEAISKRKAFLLSPQASTGWDDLLERAKFIFPGKDLNKFYGSEDYDKFIEYDYFKDIFADMYRDKIKFYRCKALKSPTPTNLHFCEFNKIYDVVYYGDRRGSYREKQLVKYMPVNKENLLIGFKQKKIDIPFMKKLKHEQLLKMLSRCRVSLILADKEHENNVITFRLYETLASQCLAAIPIEYDPERKLIKDERLRELLYVRSKADVLRLVEAYDQDLIYRQLREFKRITKQHPRVKLIERSLGYEDKDMTEEQQREQDFNFKTKTLWQ